MSTIDGWADSVSGGGAFATTLSSTALAAETSVGVALTLPEGDVGETLRDLLSPRFERLAGLVESFSPTTLALLYALLARFARIDLALGEETPR